MIGDMGRLLPLVWLLLPLYAANMAAPFVKFWPGPLWPISERWLGSHKTWMGVAFACAAATAVAFVQQRVAWDRSLVDLHDWWLFGPACGLAAMAGDAAKSLVKRRLGIAPGERWVPADQVDFMLAGLFVLGHWVDLGWRDWAWALAITLVGALAVNRLSYRLGVKNTPW